MAATGQQLSKQHGNGENRGDGRDSDAPERPGKQWPLLRVVLLCYLLALPFMAFMISTDVGFNGRWMCNPRPVGSLGTVFDRSGGLVCQFQVARVLLFWTMFAAFVSPLPILGQILYGHIQRRRTTPLEAEFSQRPLPPSFKFILSTVFYTLLAGAAIYVVYWEGAIILAALAADYPTGHKCLCVGVDLGNYSGKSNSDGIPVCCTLFIDQTLYVLAVYSLLILPVVWMARYVYDVLHREFGKRIAVD